MYQLGFDKLLLKFMGKPATVAITTKVQKCMFYFLLISSVMLVSIFTRLILILFKHCSER